MWPIFQQQKCGMCRRRCSLWPGYPHVARSGSAMTSLRRSGQRRTASSFPSAWRTEVSGIYTATNPLSDKRHNATNLICDKPYKATNVIRDKPNNLNVSLIGFVAVPDIAMPKICGVTIKNHGHDFQ